LIVETIPGLVWCASPNGDLIHVNQRILDYTGVTLDALAKSGWLGFLHPDDVELTSHIWAYSVATGGLHDVQYRLRRYDGVYRWFHVLGRPMRDAEGFVTRWYGLLIDIDDRKNMEEALRRTQTRLSRATQTATVGELAASIAHEINQPLAAVVASGLACLHFLSAQPPSLAKAYEAAESIVRDGKEAGEVVRRIRALFKRGAVEKAVLDLNDVIGEVLRLLGGEITRRRVAVETDLGKDLPPVTADRVQLQQLVLNLLLNAIEAMDPVLDRPRKLLVRSKNDSPETVLVEVRDWGVGLQNPDRVFEAFVTTKENGMGMGLAICRSIVEAHNGRLWVASGEGPGATFCFTLPLKLSAQS
jgi:PAS domain S-box-containing protein